MDKDRYRYIDKLTKNTRYKFNLEEKNTIEKIVKDFKSITKKELTDIVDSNNEFYYNVLLKSHEVPNSVKNKILKYKTSNPANLILLNDDTDIDTLKKMFSRVSVSHFGDALREQIEFMYQGTDYKLYKYIKENFSQKVIDLIADYVLKEYEFADTLYPFIALSSKTEMLLDFAQNSGLMNDKIYSYIMSNENIPVEIRDNMFDGGFKTCVNSIADINHIINPTKHMLEDIYLSSIESVIDFKKTIPDASIKGDDFLCYMFFGGVLTDDIQYDIIKRFVDEGIKSDSKIIKCIIEKTDNNELLKESLNLKSKQKTLALFNKNLDAEIAEKFLLEYINKITKYKLTDKNADLLLSVIKYRKFSEEFYNKIISAIENVSRRPAFLIVLNGLATSAFLTTQQYERVAKITKKWSEVRGMERLSVAPQRTYLYSLINIKNPELTKEQRDNMNKMIHFCFTHSHNLNKIDFTKHEVPLQVLSFFNELRNTNSIERVLKSFNEIKLNECLDMPDCISVLSKVENVCNKFLPFYKNNQLEDLSKHTLHDLTIKSMDLKYLASYEPCDIVEFYLNVDKYIDEYNRVIDELCLREDKKKELSYDFSD